MRIFFEWWDALKETLQLHFDSQNQSEMTIPGVLVLFSIYLYLMRAILSLYVKTYKLFLESSKYTWSRKIELNAAELM